MHGHDEHRVRKPLPKKEVERFEKYLKESGYEARIKTLEDTVSEFLARLNEDKVES